MFVVTVTIEVFPHEWDAFMPLMMDNARASRKEPACSRFDVATDPSREGEVCLWEIYDDEAGFEAHRQTPHFLRFDAATRDMVRRRSLTTYARLED